ncbi:MAG: hypothetical protein N4A49_16940 [Marinifilaceae bacterium]|nr:hypothetical protein [Marinifilaceae bacterium]
MKKYYWLTCKILFFIFVIACFTPLVIPTGEYTPSFCGFPKTLWAGSIVSILIIIITIIGSIFINTPEQND